MGPFVCHSVRRYSVRRYCTAVEWSVSKLYEKRVRSRLHEVGRRILRFLASREAPGWKVISLAIIHDVCMYIYIYIYTYTHICICMYVHIYIYIYTYSIIIILRFAISPNSRTAPPTQQQHLDLTDYYYYYYYYYYYFYYYYH